MATKRILYDEFRVLILRFGRMKKTEWCHKMYYDFFEWPVTAFLFFGASPVLWAVNNHLRPKGGDYHRYYKEYTISREMPKEPG